MMSAPKKFPFLMDRVSSLFATRASRWLRIGGVLVASLILITAGFHVCIRP